MRRFIPEMDMGFINGWLVARGKDILKEEDLPTHGYIVENVACGFLVSSDTSVCFLDCFITNPIATSEERNAALNRISKWVKNLAGAIGFKRIIVLSTEETIMERAQSLGFKLAESKVFAIDL